MTKAMRCAFEAHLEAQAGNPPKNRWIKMWEDVRVSVLAVLTLVLSVIVAENHGEYLRKLNWSLILLVYGSFWGMYVFNKWANRVDNTFEPVDAFLDPVTRRFSIWRTMIVITFFMGLWIMGTWTITGEIPDNYAAILTLYGTILTTFVVKAVSGEWADVKAGREPVKAEDPIVVLPDPPPK